MYKNMNFFSELDVLCSKDDTITFMKYKIINKIIKIHVDHVRFSFDINLESKLKFKLDRIKIHIFAILLRSILNDKQ